MAACITDDDDFDQMAWKLCTCSEKISVILNLNKNS